jgi:hypothetical protein
MRRTVRHAALLLALCATTAMPVRASEPWTVADSESALATASPLATCIVSIEDGSLDPYAVGAQGELGLVQLHPRGKLPEFYAEGYSDPYSPYQSVAYLEGALARGEGPAWSSYWWCA